MAKSTSSFGAVAMGLAFAVMPIADAALAQSATTSWDGTWSGGWDKGTGTQVIVANNGVIGFVWGGNYRPVTNSAATTDGKSLKFSWATGNADLTRPKPADEAQITIREGGKPPVVVKVERE
jgi:hypothetical protein